MKARFMFVLPIFIVLVFQVTAYATPEEDYPIFYAAVPWSIPDGKEANTVPTKFAPSTDDFTGFNPFCKEADCGGVSAPEPEFKTIHDYIRDYTEKTIDGAITPEEAAKKIFYEVRDFIEYENIDFFGAFFAYRYKVGNAGMKASLANAMYRSAKIPARLVIQPGKVTPKYLGYNYANNTELTDNSTLDSALFGSHHIYGEVYLNGEWVASDPAWDSGLADAFEIARFGEKLKSVKKKGAKIVAVDYPDAFLAAQPHPYLFNQNVNPATYDEAVEQKKYLYFRAFDDLLNRYLKNVRYRSTSRSMAGVAAYGIAELQEVRHLLQPGSSDFITATHAKDNLEQALKDIGKGKTADAKVKLAAAEDSVCQLSVFWDDLDIMMLRTRIAYFTRQGDVAVLKGQEANPTTYNVSEPYDNSILNWQVLYGYDEWTTPAMEGYILENLYIQMYKSYGVPMKIDTIIDDNYTVLIDPTNLSPQAGDVPDVLVDHFGNLYDPTTIPWEFDGLTSGYTPFLSSENTAVYSMPVPNGFPDLFEADGNARVGRYFMMGGRGWQRERQDPDDHTVANRFLDKYSDIAYFPIFAMDNDVARDTVDRIGESGATKLLFNGGNNLVADFTYLGYEWEIKKYIAEGIAEGRYNNLEYIQVETYGMTDVYIEGFVDALEAEMDNYPDGARVVVSLVSHGFPYHDLMYTAFGYPGCTNMWLQPDVNPFGCPMDPVDGCDFDLSPEEFEACLRQPGKFIWPTGYIYAEDTWFQNNWDQFDLMLAEIENNHPALFAKLDSNNNGVIKNDELIQSGNMFSAAEYDPYDRWVGSEEWFQYRYMDDGMGGSIELPPYLKEMIDYDNCTAVYPDPPCAVPAPIDYWVDIPYYWDIESTETIMHRHMLFPMTMGTGGMTDMDHNMIWLDDTIRSETVFDPDDYHMIWGEPGSYEPINVVVTRMLMEHTTVLHDAYMEKYDKAVSETTLP